MNKSLTCRVGISAGCPELNKLWKVNPHFTYGQAVGYSIGLSAYSMNQKYNGLSKEEWQYATDDYAWGYRKAWEDQEKKAKNNLKTFYAKGDVIL